MKTIFCLVLVMVAALAMVPFAQATIIFADTFEGGTVGADIGPAQVGTYVAGGAIMNVTNAAGPGANNPGPFAGQQHGHIQRDSVDQEYKAFGIFSIPQTGGTVHWEAYIYLVSGQLQIGLNDGTGFGPQININTDGSVDVVANGSSYAGTPLTHQLNTWELWEIDYAVGTLSYLLTVDGNSATVNLTSGLATWGGFFIWAQGSGVDEGYVDSILATRTSIPGDVNGDENADLTDYNIIQTNYGMTAASLADGDLTLDGIVNLFDFKTWKANRTDGGGGALSVPEPTSTVLMGLGAGALLSVLRRRTC